MATVNTAVFGWKDLEVRVQGRVVTGIQNIRYDDNVQKEFVYGAGGKPQAIKEGNESVEGSMSLFQAELDVLAKSAPEGRISKLRNASIQLSYADSSGNIVTKSLNGVAFLKDGFDGQQGQTNLVVEVPFMALSVTTS